MKNKHRGSSFDDYLEEYIAKLTKVVEAAIIAHRNEQFRLTEKNIPTPEHMADLYNALEELEEFYESVD